MGTAGRGGGIGRSEKDWEGWGKICMGKRQSGPGSEAIPKQSRHITKLFEVISLVK